MRGVAKLLVLSALAAAISTPALAGDHGSRLRTYGSERFEERRQDRFDGRYEEGERRALGEQEEIRLSDGFFAGGGGVGGRMSSSSWGGTHVVIVSDGGALGSASGFATARAAASAFASASASISLRIAGGMRGGCNCSGGRHW